MTLLKAVSFGYLAIAAVLYGRLESPYRCRLLEYLYWCAALVATGCILTALKILPSGPGNFAGPFANSNSLGAFIPLVAPILLLRVFRSSDKRPLTRVATAALPIAFLIFLFMSRSRGGIVATFLACGWWLFFCYRKAFGLFVGAAVLSAVIISADFPQYMESLDQIYINKGSSYVLQSREALLRDSWEAAKESPLIGVGFGVTKGYSEGWEFGFETGVSREKMNSYLALVEEVGVVGSSFLMLSIASLLIASTQRLLLLARFYPSSEEFWTTLTLSACALGGLVNAFFEAWLTAAGFFSTTMFWLIFGVLAARLSAPVRVPR